MRSPRITDGVAWIDQEPVDLEAALAKAVELLGEAQRPLVADLGLVSTEAQRVAVAIADRLGGVADWTSTEACQPPVLAFQTVGSTGASYGEVAERADLVIYWRCDPTPLPGFDRIAASLEREVLQVGGDCFPLSEGADYEAAHVLRAIVAGIDLDPATVATQTGAPLETWRRLADKLLQADYAVIITSQNLAQAGPEAVAALTQLAQQLHTSTRVALAPLERGANELGAENVLAWQTGFPMAVDFSRGYPRYGPGEFSTRSLLEREECDAVLVFIGPIRHEEPPSAQRLVVGRRSPQVEVAIGVASLETGGGTYYRADGVALPLPERSDTSLPTAVEILSQILAALEPG